MASENRRNGPGRPFEPGNQVGKQFQPGQSGNPGGRPKSATGFRERCRKVARKLLRKLEKESFQYSTGEHGGGTDVAGLVKAFEAMADRGGYLPADKQALLLLKLIESPALKDEDRTRVIDELTGREQEPAQLEPKPEE